MLRLRLNLVMSCCLLAALLLSACAASGATFIWWEGERPSQTNLPDNSRDWLMPKTPAETDCLSEGSWLVTQGPEANGPYHVTYDVQVDTRGEYSFWTRKFWKHGPFRWRFDDTAWATCGADCALADMVELRQYVCANWVYLGSVTLAAGRHALRIEMLDKKGGGAFDCFVLAAGAFSPSGRMKPGEKYNRSAEGWFPFEPGPDEFAASDIDLRYLNDPEAGTKGFLRADGDRFVFEKDSTPVRFWAVNAGPTASAEGDAYLARRLAKLGVNMVRIHSAVFDAGAADPATVDAAYLDRLHRFVAALKKEGIYVHLSFYFPVWFKVKPSYGIPGFDTAPPGNQDRTAFGLLFFDPRMQEIYKSWARGLLRTKNPYTGLALADDPAVGIVEIINEDNYFFWTFRPGEVIPREALAPLEKRFGEWLAARHGTLDAAFAAWGSDKYPPGDDRANGRVVLYDAGHLTSAGWARSTRNEARARDQVRFLTEDLRGFFTGMERYFRDELKVKCAVSATNWITADERVLGPLDKYAASACDVMDRHGYFSGRREAERFYALAVGDRHADKSALRAPEGLPLAEVRYAGRPHIVTEVNWTMPNRFRAEMAPLLAAYGALQGTDGIFNFAIPAGSSDWQNTHTVWSLFTPAEIGQFPAAALIYRRGYVKEGPVVVKEALRLADLYDFAGSAVSAPQSLDELRKMDVPTGGAGDVPALTSVDPLAFYVGRVERIIGDDPGRSAVSYLARFIDRSKGTITSATRELSWDYRRGVLLIDSPCAQGAVGFLKDAGKVSLPGVAIETPVEYGAILVVSLDGRPLADSRKVLLQVMTEDRNYGWQTEQKTLKGSDGKDWTADVVTDLGAPPIEVKEPQGTVTLLFAGDAPLTVTPLDLNGYPRPGLSAPAPGGKIDLRGDTIYYVISR